MLTVTCDTSANLKLLRGLELSGHIQLWGVFIEAIPGTGRINADRKQLTTAIVDSEFALIGKCAIASNDTPYKRIQEIIGKQNHADALHLEKHIVSGRDVFATSDTDFIKHRQKLEEAFNISIMTAEELQASLS